MTNRPHRDEFDEPPNVGLAAFSSVENWEVTIDESTTGKVRWFAQIDGPSIYMRFEIPSSQMMRTLGNFLQYADNSSKELVIGSLNDAPVTVIRDNEHQDRFFIWMCKDRGNGVQICLGGKDLIALSLAIRQVADSL